MGAGRFAGVTTNKGMIKVVILTKRKRGRGLNGTASCGPVRGGTGIISARQQKGNMTSSNSQFKLQVGGKGCCTLHHEGRGGRGTRRKEKVRF